MSRTVSSGGLFDHADEHAAFGALALELDLAVHRAEQRVIRAHAHVRARVHLRAALTNEDVAGQNRFAAEALHTEPLGVGLAAVTSAAACLFVCHESVFLRGLSRR